MMSFVGYIYECIAMTLWSGKWDNRGFLFGPIIPIYGIASLLGLLFFTKIFPSYNMLHVFLIGFVVSGLVEYPTSYILEKVFNARWWDYSIGPWNINGRVSLLSSLGFGVGAVIIIYVINPVIVPFIFSLNTVLAGYISKILMLIISIDVIMTLYYLYVKKTPIIYTQLNERIENKVEELNPRQLSMYRALKKRTNLFK